MTKREVAQSGGSYKREKPGDKPKLVSRTSEPGQQPARPAPAVQAKPTKAEENPSSKPSKDAKPAPQE